MALFSKLSFVEKKRTGLSHAYVPMLNNIHGIEEIKLEFDEQEEKKANKSGKVENEGSETELNKNEESASAPSKTDESL